jgi:hypothetical protein
MISRNDVFIPNAVIASSNNTGAIPANDSLTDMGIHPVLFAVNNTKNPTKNSGTRGIRRLTVGSLWDVVIHTVINATTGMSIATLKSFTKVAASPDSSETL